MNLNHINLPSRLKRLCYISLVMISFNLITPLKAAAETNFDVNAKAAIAIDAETGKIFYEKNADTPLPIASMTKLLTLYIVLEAEKNGQISWDEQIEISDHLLKISEDLNLSNVKLVKGSSYSVRDLFNASTIISANAAVTALAERIAGTEKDFVDLMRAKALSLGIDDAYLISTSGINNEDAQGRIYPGSKENEENLMSAKDVALVAQHLIHDFPEFLETTKLPSAVFAEGTDEETLLESSNFMLPGFYYYKEGVDGLKTGTTDLAGASFAGTIVKNDLRVITVVMNANESDGDGGLRFVETTRLMDFVYDNWAYEILYPEGSSLPGYNTIDVPNGMDLTVPIVTNDPLQLWHRKDMNKKNLAFKMENTYGLLDKDNGLKAPIKTGQQVGTLQVSYPEDSLGYLDGAQQTTTVSMVTDGATKKANFFVLSSRSIKHFFSNIF
ncbi:D-alanyl-D-alanine carboxypeptidase [Vagococcus sp. BWB3-3]|uniref:serine-type D-Ala-D-Ala carboxypeptidase n=1 Tax=Vagococcus allomyrinae TaxID=2794353 RepID=A0A940PC99_9ENTE|nr:serine hydrolase [Vagococcus allomyrinae]MBP1041358.1 D-alanyl-D-alanine carboxypeptidase [Vagococcus allomyrinae]